MSLRGLIYSFVAKGTVVLAEYTAFSGNFSTIAVQCLQKLPSNSNKHTFSCDGHTFNFLVDNGFVFLVVAHETVGRIIPFAFLERLKDDFKRLYGVRIGLQGPHPLADDDDDDLFEDTFGIAYNLDKEFGPRIKEHMEYCMSHPEELSKISKIKAQMSEVKGIMMDNIDKINYMKDDINCLVDSLSNLKTAPGPKPNDSLQLVKVLDRGEKIEVLVDKTENLQFQTDSFHRQGRQLRRKMWLQNLKLKLMVGGAVLIVIIIIWLMACRGFKC